MKVIIIEGCDRTGKDTLINNLTKHYKNTKIIHSGIPKTDNLFNFYYNGLIQDTLAGYYDSSLDAVIHNRSMYGEYVYGPKYRGESKQSIAELINKLEVGQLKTFIRSKDLYFILLTSTDPTLLVKNDDGLSLSSNVDDIKDEISSFDEIFNSSLIENKKKIFVNENSNFRSADDIYREVINFISR